MQMLSLMLCTAREGLKPAVEGVLSAHLAPPHSQQTIGGGLEPYCTEDSAIEQGGIIQDLTSLAPQDEKDAAATATTADLVNATSNNAGENMKTGEGVAFPRTVLGELLLLNGDRDIRQAAKEFYDSVLGVLTGERNPTSRIP